MSKYKLTATFLYSGLIDYWGGNSRRCCGSALLPGYGAKILYFVTASGAAETFCP
jgi:hypothetical protein